VGDAWEGRTRAGRSCGRAGLWAHDEADGAHPPTPGVGHGSVLLRYGFPL